MARIKDITGQRFGRLVAISNEGRLQFPKVRDYFWKCQCDCGNTSILRGVSLRAGRTQSCGCLHKESVSQMAKKHGLRGHPSYSIWKAMIERCFHPNCKVFHRYGGRGITVCDRWLSVENFIADMGVRPTEGLTLERINNDIGYSPENCKWATRYEQQRNRQCNILISFNGETKCATDWATAIGISLGALQNRLKKQWPLADALSRPHQPGRAFRYSHQPAKVAIK